MMADQPTPADWARIARHVAGDESPTDARATHAWIREDPRRAAAAESARRIWALTGDLTAAARAEPAAGSAVRCRLAPHARKAARLGSHARLR